MSRKGYIKETNKIHLFLQHHFSNLCLISFYLGYSQNLLRLHWHNACYAQLHYEYFSTSMGHMIPLRKAITDQLLFMVRKFLQNIQRP